jgi:hypothetical protein
LGKLEELKLKATQSNPDLKKPDSEIILPSKDIQSEISSLLESLFDFLIYLQKGSDIYNLCKTVNADNSFEQFLSLITKAFISQPTEQMIAGLQIFLKRDSLAALTKDFLSDLNEQIPKMVFRNTQETSTEDYERQFYSELQQAVKAGIHTAFLEKLDPKKRVEAEVRAFVDDLKANIAEFKREVDKCNSARLSLKDTQQLEKAHKSLVNRFDPRYQRVEKETNPLTMIPIQKCTRAFYDIKKNIHEKIKQLHDLALAKDAEERLKVSLLSLQQLLDPLIITPEDEKQPANYEFLYKKLIEMGFKTYTSEVNTLVSNLLRALETFGTIEKKRDNK